MSTLARRPQARGKGLTAPKVSTLALREQAIYLFRTRQAIDESRIELLVDAALEASIAVLSQEISLVSAPKKFTLTDFLLLTLNLTLEITGDKLITSSILGALGATLGTEGGRVGRVSAEALKEVFDVGVKVTKTGLEAGKEIARDAATGSYGKNVFAARDMLSAANNVKAKLKAAINQSRNKFELDVRSGVMDKSLGYLIDSWNSVPELPVAVNELLKYKGTISRYQEMVMWAIMYNLEGKIPDLSWDVKTALLDYWEEQFGDVIDEFRLRAVSFPKLKELTDDGKKIALQEAFINVANEVRRRSPAR